MVAQRLLFIGFLALFANTEGYRVNSLSRGKVEARGKSKAKVNFKRVGVSEGASSNSSIFIAAGLIGAFAGTLSVTAAAPGVVTAAAGATALVSNCAPSIGLVAPALAAGGAGAPPAMLVVAPLAILAALALIGGLVALHISSSAALAALAFCPVSNFAQEPMQALVNSQPYLAFPDDLPEMMDDGLDGGMPECRDMKTAMLAETMCAQNDKECQEHACREKCCEDESCTFYQFSVDHDAADNVAQVVCQLGEKYLLSDSNCEKPFFGEVCASRLPFWKQIGEDRTKCVSGYGAGSGFLVDDQMDCQETAIANGHCFYQYNEEKKTCATCKDDSDMDTGVRDNWKVYQDPSCGGSHVMTGAVCLDWQLKKVLLHKVKGTKEVRPVSRGCRGNSASCLKKRCRQECSKSDDCTFYQFQEESNKCFLGTAEILDETDQEKPSYGGFVSSERKCKSGFQCPSTKQCVDDCSECEGYSQNGDPSRARGKKARNWCERSNIQQMCNDENWIAEYRGVSLDQWCTGMEKVTVDITEELDSRETGENLCRQACCSSPDCVSYQMDKADAEKTGADFSKGDSVQCSLGLETSGGKPLFKCAGVAPKKSRSKQAPVGMALKARGCTGGSVACMTKRTCVDHCRTECMGAPLHNEAKGICETETTAEEEHLDFASDKRHKHAFKDNFVSATPKLSTNGDDAYFLEEDKSQAKKYKAQDDILALQMNSKKVQSGAKGDMASACDGLKETQDENMLCYFDEDGGETATQAGACECEFKQQQSCSNWFLDDKHLKYVVEDVGMLIFLGELCKCETEKIDGMYRCSFGLKDEIPKVKADKGDTASMTLAGRKDAVCPPNKCDAVMNEKMPGATGTVVSFGTHNCGYTYSAEDNFYCDSKCNCHQELDDDDIEKGKELEDDECIETVCPEMSKCSPLNYGSYGCGYSCENAEGDFFFCSQDCECESDE